MERQPLGKGLEALLSESADVGRIAQIPLGQIRPNPHQPRRSFDQEPLNELAESIRQMGVLQPIVVRQVAIERYELVAGERRLRASKLAGLATIPAVVRSTDEITMLAAALVENLQREDINAVDAARAYRKLVDEFALTQTEVAQRVGKSQAAVSNAMRMLALPMSALALIEVGRLSEGHGRALLMVKDTSAQRKLLQEVVDADLSVRDTERRAREVNTPVPSPFKGEKPISEPPPIPKTDTGGLSESEFALIQANADPWYGDPNVQAAARRLSERYGTRVEFIRTPRGGRICIDFYSQEDLDRVVEQLER